MRLPEAEYEQDIERLSSIRLRWIVGLSAAFVTVCIIGFSVGGK